MASVGGSLESVSLRGRNFSVPADAELQRKIGGFENEILANGDGTVREIKTVVPLSVTGLTIQIDDSRGDQEFLQDLADSPDYFDVTLTYASGIVWQCTAQIVGGVEANSQSALAEVSLSGPGKLTTQ